MDKSAERKLFDYVYGQVRDWEVISSEAPDFLCKRNDSILLGVEVTELWQTESHARLNNINDYAVELLEGGRYHHKDDQKIMKVGPVKYMLSGEENRIIELTAISYEMPGLKETVCLLERAIKSKAQKAPAYEEICPTVDLLIRDSSSLFL